MPVMPDPRVPLGAVTDGGGQSSGPFQTLGALMQIKERYDAYKDKQRADEDDDATREALQMYQRPEDAIEHLRKAGRYRAVAALSQYTHAERKAQFDEEDAALKSHQARFEQGTSMLDTVTDDKTLGLIRPQMLKMMAPTLGEEATANLIPSSYGDGKWKEPLIKAGTSRALQIQQKRDNLAQLGVAHGLGLVKTSEFRNAMGLPDDKDIAEWSQNALKAQDQYREILGRELKEATNDGQYQTIMEAAVEHGYPEVVIKGFPPTWSEANAPRAGRLGMTVYEQENAAANQTRAEATADREDRLGRGGTVTEARKIAEEERRETEDAATETFAQEAFKKAHPLGTWKREGGRLVPPDFSYDGLSDDAKLEYVKRRVRTQDKYRDRILGLPPTREAAKAALASGDTEGYEKLRGEFAAVTGKVGDFDSYVGLKSRGAAPAGAPGNRQQIEQLQKQLLALDPEKDAARMMELYRQLNTLTTGLK